MRNSPSGILYASTINNTGSPAHMRTGLPPYPPGAADVAAAARLYAATGAWWWWPDDVANGAATANVPDEDGCVLPGFGTVRVPTPAACADICGEWSSGAPEAAAAVALDDICAGAAARPAGIAAWKKK